MIQLVFLLSTFIACVYFLSINDRGTILRTNNSDNFHCSILFSKTFFALFAIPNNSKQSLIQLCRTKSFAFLYSIQHHRLAPPCRTSLFFPKNSPHLLLCPSYLSSLSPRSGEPCHKLSNN